MAIAALSRARPAIPGPAPTRLEDRKQLPAWRFPGFYQVVRVVLPGPEVRAEVSSSLCRGEKRPSSGRCGSAWWQPSPSSAQALFIPLPTPTPSPRSVPDPRLSASHRTSANPILLSSPAAPAPSAAPTPIPHPHPRASSLRAARLLRSHGGWFLPSRGAARPRGGGTVRGP